MSATNPYLDPATPIVIPEIDAVAEVEGEVEMVGPGLVDGLSPVTGWPTTLLLPAPDSPLPVARKILEISEHHDHLAHWRGDFYLWTGTHWEAVADSVVRHWVYAMTEHATYLDTRSGDHIPWTATRRTIADVLDALGHGVVHRDDRDPEASDGLVPLTNGLLDPDTLELTAHDPGRFGLYRLDFPHDPNARCPEWERFLGQALEDDADRIALLREWFGYVLCGGTRYQKIMSMSGPPRCGKGTILRVLTAMVGPRHTVAPASLDSLGGTFGLEPLIGKRLAVMGDVQWTGRNLSEVAGILLGISGEDSVTVNRKNRTAWTGILPTRFMFAGNDQPRFRSTSGALPNRMLHLRFQISMLGREDHALGDRLLAELPGVFNWAVEGWRALRERDGRFTIDDLGRDIAAEVGRSASPVAAFVQDACVVEASASVPLHELYGAYERWRERGRMQPPSGTATFSRDLQSACPSIRGGRQGSARQGNRVPMVYGVRLATVVNHDRVTPPTAGPDRAPDQADQADQATQDDHRRGIVPGQRPPGPGGPGGPGISTNNRSVFTTSTERGRNSATGAILGPTPGPPGPPHQTPPLTRENTWTRQKTHAWSANDDLWAGFDLDDAHGPSPTSPPAPPPGTLAAPPPVPAIGDEEWEEGEV